MKPSILEWCPECEGDLHIEQSGPLTCPHCGARWHAEADADWDSERGFRGSYRLTAP